MIHIGLHGAQHQWPVVIGSVSSIVTFRQKFQCFFGTAGMLSVAGNGLLKDSTQHSAHNLLGSLAQSGFLIKELGNINT